LFKYYLDRVFGEGSIVEDKEQAELLEEKNKPTFLVQTSQKKYI